MEVVVAPPLEHGWWDQRLERLGTLGCLCLGPHLPLVDSMIGL
jgi:hypothetical protein